MKIKLIIVEDDQEVMQGLKNMLSLSEELEIVGVFENGEEFCTEANEAADVVLMDIGLPGLSGIECVQKMKPEMPDTQFLMCTSFEDEQKVFEALKAGANGYLLKNSAIHEIIQSINEIHHGGSPMSRKIARKVIQSFHSFSPTENEYNLSSRETEILDYLAKGFRYKEIAEKLFISVETVRTHIRNIYSKLQVQSRTEAINKYYR